MLHRKECIRKSSLKLFGFNWYHTIEYVPTIFKREKLMLSVLYIIVPYSQLNYFFCEATVILST
jgi:hypothetical protein